jgi:hypothetical protein
MDINQLLRPKSMKLSAIAVSALIACATPAIALAPSFTVAASATSRDIPSVTYSNYDWLITVRKRGGDYIYTGINQQNGNKIVLYGCNVSRSRDRVVYRWRNKGTVYQVSWRPSDSAFARLQVYSPSGRTLLNTLVAVGE